MMSELFIKPCEHTRLICLPAFVDHFLFPFERGREVTWKMKIRLTAFANSFSRAEEKHPFLDKRAADRCTGVQAEKKWDVGVRHVGSVQHVIAMKKGNGTVQVIRSALGQHVDDAPRAMTELGLVTRRQHLKLQNRILI